MKKLFFVAAVAAAFLSSCAKEENPGSSDKAQLTIKLSGVQPNSRAIGAPGATGNLELHDGYIFVLDASTGAVVAGEALNVASEVVAGGSLTHVFGGATPKLVPSDAHVYILGNVPAGIVPASLTSWSAIQAAVSQITANTDYTDAAMANNTGIAAAIDIVSEGKGEASISLSPLYSRIELHKVTGLGKIVSFNVAGVYVDSYYPAFTMSGAASGNAWDQQQNKVFTGNIGNAGAWPSATKMAAPAAGDVWAYHVPAAGVPRLIVHLTNIVWDNSAGGGSATQVIAGDRYITVTGYTGFTAPFLRGKIYRVGGTTTGIAFDEGDLGLTPNPENVELTAEVDVLDWVLEDLTPSI